MNIRVPVRAMQRNAGIARLSASGATGRTMLGRLYQSGNAKIRVPDRHQRKSLEAVMINISGGMTGGDTLQWSFEGTENAILTLTSQACEKVYSSNSGAGCVDIKLNASNGARLNWLPQETIVFDQGDLVRRMDVELSADATALIVEPLVFGRKAMGELVRYARVKDRWRVSVDGRLIHAEDFALSGDVEKRLDEAAIGGGRCAMATMLLVAPDAERYVGPLVAILGDTGSVSAWGGKLLVRILAHDSYDLRLRLIPAIKCLSGNDHLPKCWTL